MVSTALLNYAVIGAENNIDTISGEKIEYSVQNRAKIFSLMGSFMAAAYAQLNENGAVGQLTFFCLYMGLIM